MSPQRSFTVATYNVLADAYLKPEYYARCDARDLRPQERHPRLLARATGLGVDILCLQEVEHAAFTRLDDRLRPLGYAGRWAHKERGKPDGCATFVRAPLVFLENRIVAFRDGHLADGPSGHVFLQSLVGWGDGAVTVFNTHLKWDAPDAPPERRYGSAQAAQLLVSMHEGPFPIIACGDFNAEPDGGILAAFRASGFEDPHPQDQPTFNAAGPPRKIDFLLHRGRIAASVLPTPPVGPDTPLPSASEPSDHVPLAARYLTLG